MDFPSAISANPRPDYSVPEPQENTVVVDAIQFGTQASEGSHQPLGVLAETRDAPQSLYGGPTFSIPPSPDQEFNSWRDCAGEFGFFMNIPALTVLRTVQLQICCRRYPNFKSARPDNVMSFRTIVASHKGNVIDRDCFVPADGKWHVLNLFLGTFAPFDRAPCHLAVMIDDSANIRPDGHFGFSLSHAVLTCSDDNTIRGDEIRARRSLGREVDPEVALLMCPVWDVTMPPISLGVLDSYLRANGVSTRVFDFNTMAYLRSSDDDRRLWHGYSALRWGDRGFCDRVLEHFRPLTKELAESVAGCSATVVAASVYSTNLVLTSRVLQEVKRMAPEKTVVLGGPGLIFSDVSSLGDAWDYLVAGDGERPLLDIVRGNADQSGTALHRSNFHGYIPNQMRYSEPDLNDLPLIDFDGFDLTTYTDFTRVPAYTSRGCVRRCAYCFDASYYAPFRFLEGKRAFEHLRHLAERHGRRYIELSDLLCNGNRKSVLEMSELISSSGLGIQWGGFAIIRKDMTCDDYARLREGGCDYLRYGFETACEKHLKGMRRGYSKTVARETLERTKSSGIRVHINLLVGFPGETDETVDETIQFLEENCELIDVIDTVNTVAMMPLTSLMENPGEFGIDVADDGTWKSGDEQAAGRNWALRVMDAARAAGIQCHGGMVEGTEMDIPFVDAQ